MNYQLKFTNYLQDLRIVNCSCCDTVRKLLKVVNDDDHIVKDSCCLFAIQANPFSQT